MAVCGTHSNPYYPSCVEQFVLVGTRSGDHKKCTDVVLKDILLQMYITPFVNVRDMRELMRKASPDRNFINRYMINNVSIGDVQGN